MYLLSLFFEAILRITAPNSALFHSSFIIPSFCDKNETISQLCTRIMEKNTDALIFKQFLPKNLSFLTENDVKDVNFFRPTSTIVGTEDKDSSIWFPSWDENTIKSTTYKAQSVNIVALGGTFDRLHIGHKVFLPPFLFFLTIYSKFLLFFEKYFKFIDK